MHDRDDISEFALERRVEVGAALNGAQAVAVRQLREYTDVAAVFELDACVKSLVKADAYLAPRAEIVETYGSPFLQGGSSTTFYGFCGVFRGCVCGYERCGGV